MAPNRATRPAEPGATNAGPAGRGSTDLAPEDLIERLQDVLARHPAVAVAYLFGSRARGRTSPLSDIDVAVLLDRAFVGDRFALQLELAGSIAAAVGSDAVDVVLLDDAPPSLAYRVLRDGRVILCRDELLRVRHRLRAIDEYLDTELLRRRNRAILRRRLTEGTFGRS
jgi:predicted nucleotidyltransferase